MVHGRAPRVDSKPDSLGRRVLHDAKVVGVKPRKHRRVGCDLCVSILIGVGYVRGWKERVEVERERDGVLGERCVGRGWRV